MSGPIVRRYGFPNFDAIFGKRELQHGVDDPATPPEGDAEQAPAPKAESASGPLTDEASGKVEPKQP